MSASTARDLSKLFNPQSVAVVGASRDPAKVGGIVLRNLKESGFPGAIFPVNPNAELLNGLKCYKSIAELPNAVDLAIVALPADLAMQSLEMLANKGIKNIVMFASGFKETGFNGAKQELKLLELTTKYELNVLGPNCLGFLNNKVPINATFGESVNQRGNIKFITQSGAIASSIFDWANSLGMGFDEFVTLGNKTVVNENDVLRYFLASNPTPIGMYLESISNGTEFLKLTSEATKKVPVFVIKPGKTAAAISAMKSHTGSLTGEDAVFQAALDQAGVLRCTSLEDFFDLVRAFTWGTLPAGPKVAVISNAGGPGVLSADAVVSSGLQIVEFNQNTKAKLEQVLPRSASLLDPVDLMGDALAERYGHSAEIIFENAEVDMLLFILTPQLMTQVDKTAEYIAFISKKYNKPIFCSFIGGNLIAEGEKILNANKIPVFRFPERAIFAMAQMYKYVQKRDQLQAIKKPDKLVELPQDSDAVRTIVQKAVNEKFTALDNVSADSIVKSIGIPTPPTQNVANLQDAQNFVEQYGWPVVLKLSSPEILHKKQLGGVITEITSQQQLDDSMHKLERIIEQLKHDTKESTAYAIQIQKGIASGIEVIVGIKHDPTFGPVMMFGAGGSYVELIKDQNLHLLPIGGLSDVETLVKSSRIYNLLKSGEGKPAYALDKLFDLIARVGKLATVIPEASEIEINPVIVTLNDVWAVDTKIVMHKSTLPLPEVSVKTAGPKYLSAICLEHTNLSMKFNHYKFECSEPLMFEPGQYISVKVGENAIRAYSIATHYDDHHFDLLVDTRPGGPGSTFFEHLKKGDTMLYLGPFGKFTFNHDDGAKNLLFLATGSGASAVRCMIDRALVELKMKKPMKLYFGLTYQEELFWRDHFDNLASKYPNFTYEIALYKPNDNWNGAKGFITELLKRDVPNATECAAYLCGHRAMISDAHDILLANGCPEERIYTERFV
jgi:acetate---CoA ligase (ADP-forming)